MDAAPLQSWADVAVNSGGPQTLNDRGLEFRWKAVKKGRLRPTAMPGSAKCESDHCQTSNASCNRRECIARLEKTLTVVKAENIRLASAFETRLLDLDKLRQEIDEECKTEDFFSADMEASRLAVVKAKQSITKPVFCECASCQLGFHQSETALLNERLAAAQHRMQLLREFRIANDRKTTYRTSTGFNRSTKYFTPVGRSKGNGVSALRPALQMQNSYDVVALTTNSMAARPLKIAWRDKPKLTRPGPSRDVKKAS